MKAIKRVALCTAVAIPERVCRVPSLLMAMYPRRSRPPSDDDLRSSSLLSSLAKPARPHRTKVNPPHPAGVSSSMYLDNAHADKSESFSTSLTAMVPIFGRSIAVSRLKSRHSWHSKFLQSDLRHLIDPLIVRDGEEFSMEEYERLCCQEVKLKYLRLYRATPAFDPSTMLAGPQAPPVAPYVLWLWLGNGTAVNADIPKRWYSF
ncbi:hypothetical protein V1525DRAFT_271414 [Lipomyces kononenkoae]|uniref:Uncharacterized protein n=1 Tax=Lipomyces kononenkoae TaxID=34357 RepID=A0ACC3SVF4_LIPKO